jgi:hypothetical protein
LGSRKKNQERKQEKKIREKTKIITGKNQEKKTKMITGKKLCQTRMFYTIFKMKII